MFVLVVAACGRLAFDPGTPDGQGSGDAAVLGDGGGGSGVDAFVEPPVMCTRPPALVCRDVDAGSGTGMIASGTTAGQLDDYQASCAGAGEEDVVIQWQAPRGGRWFFDTQGSVIDTVLSRHDGCAGADLACNDDDPTAPTWSSLTLDLDPCTNVTLVVDGTVASGAYELSARLKCPSVDLGSQLGPSLASGTTIGWGESYASSCGGLDEPDVALLWTAPAAGAYRFTTQGSSFDTVVSVLAGCAGAELGCNDDDPGGAFSTVTVTLGAGQQVAIVIDGANGGGTYNLGIAAQ